MESYLNTSIKEIIGQFPEIEDVLDKHGIGCGACSVGICLLKDIVDVHRLPETDRDILMTRIAETIGAEEENA